MHVTGKDVWKTHPNIISSQSSGEYERIFGEKRTVSHYFIQNADLGPPVL